MELCVLGSGSSGNAIYIAGESSQILIDAGFSMREVRRRLTAEGRDLEGLDGLILTHEHGDHIRGAGPLARALKVPVHATGPTLKAGRSRLGKLPEAVELQAGTPFQIGEFRIEPFSISHDAADPIGLVVRSRHGSAAVLTDLGFVTRLVRERIRGVEALVLETNHDEELLKIGPYPWPLKQRILSRLGHLSNDAAAVLLSEIMHDGLQEVLLAHLSEENNNPDLALITIRSMLEEIGRDGVQTRLTSQRQSTGIISL